MCVLGHPSVFIQYVCIISLFTEGLSVKSSFNRIMLRCLLAVYWKFNALDFNSGVYSLSHEELFLTLISHCSRANREKEVLVLCENVSECLYCTPPLEETRRSWRCSFVLTHRPIIYTTPLVQTCEWDMSFLPVSPLQITLAVCFILMFGNSMLLTSFYASSLVSIWVSWTFFSVFY